jgi:hypothetical protein
MLGQSPTALEEEDIKVFSCGNGSISPTSVKVVEELDESHHQVVAQRVLINEELSMY